MKANACLLISKNLDCNNFVQYIFRIFEIAYNIPIFKDYSNSIFIDQVIQYKLQEPLGKALSCYCHLSSPCFFNSLGQEVLQLVLYMFCACFTTFYDHVVICQYGITSFYLTVMMVFRFLFIPSPA